MRELLLLVVISGCGGLAPRGATPSQQRTVEAEGVTITLDLSEAEDSPVDHDALERWVKRSADLVTTYLGEFPVPTLKVEIAIRGWGEVGFGQHWNGRRVRVRIGRGTTERDLEHDWVMVHEMFHTTLPKMGRRHRWMDEGLSTYLETIVRSRAGYIREADAWSNWESALHHGQPRSGDRGLDNTPTWGRVYWGGALFWLVVDVTLHRQTRGEATLADALRGIREADGNARKRWDIEDVVAAADRGTGVTVVSDLYHRMASQPVVVDLDVLFRSLGVVADESGEVRFDDEAPLSWVRRSLTAPR